jgi:mRNA deadenylase 3'-5' endonuclease subunit Ccr4
MTTQIAAVVGSGPTKVHIVSYNVLSSHLSSPSHFTTYPIEHLAPEKRLPCVLEKLEEELGAGGVDQADKASVIFCLQEVSYDWAGTLD